MLKFDIDEALKEVQEKEEVEIELETAAKWLGRSCACYQLYDETDEIKWLLNAESYGNEAIEHAALCKDNGKTLKLVLDGIEKYKTSHKKKSSFRIQEIKKLFG